MHHWLRWGMEATIGDVFVAWSRANDGEFRRVYEQYTVNYHIAMSRLVQCQAENRAFAAWLAQTEAAEVPTQSSRATPTSKVMGACVRSCVM
jgi:hypothetical protein